MIIILIFVNFLVSVIVLFVRFVIVVCVIWDGVGFVLFKCVYFVNYISNGDFVLIWVVLLLNLC